MCMICSGYTYHPALSRSFPISISLLFSTSAFSQECVFFICVVLFCDPLNLTRMPTNGHGYELFTGARETQAVTSLKTMTLPPLSPLTSPRSYQPPIAFQMESLHYVEVQPVYTWFIELLIKGCGILLNAFSWIWEVIMWLSSFVILAGAVTLLICVWPLLSHSI